MWSDKVIKRNLCVGYTFVYKGVHHTILRLHGNKMYLQTYEGRTYYMTYTHFQTTNHFKSRYLNQKRVGISK